MALDGDVLLAYLTVLAETSSLSTIEQTYASVLKAAAADARIQSDLRSSVALQEGLRGIRRTKQRTERPRQARALESGEIRALITHLAGQPDEAASTTLRDRTLLLFGSGTGLRASELVALSWSDITPRPEQGGIEVTVRFSKTSDLPQTLVLARLAEVHKDTCPVRALEQWRAHVAAGLAVDDATLKDMPVLLQVRRGAHLTGTGLKPDAVTQVLQRLCAQSGVNPEGVSSHTLRATYATRALDSGVPLPAVMAARWNSTTTVARYDRRTRWEVGAGNVWLGGI